MTDRRASDPRPTLADLRGRATMTIEETARVLGIGRHAAWRAIRRGEIPSLRLGRRIFVPVPKLLALLGVEEDGSPNGEPNESG